jgi:hypothetical protein
MTRLSVGIALACSLAAGPVLAHHDGSVLGTVRIAQPVLADGKPLAPGTYELRDAGEHPEPLPGQSEDAMTWIEFVAGGTVVARSAAEVMPGEPVAVGTSGRASQPVVQLLRGGDFLRVSTYRDGERYLIHLPVQRAN